MLIFSAAAGISLLILGGMLVVAINQRVLNRQAIARFLRQPGNPLITCRRNKDGTMLWSITTKTCSLTLFPDAYVSGSEAEAKAIFRDLAIFSKDELYHACFGHMASNDVDVERADVDDCTLWFFRTKSSEFSGVALAA